MKRMYRKLRSREKQKLIKRFGVTAAEKRRYVLSTNADFEILSRCKQLEKKRLTNEDKYVVKLIKTQLVDDWRAPLIRTLNKLLKKNI